MTVVSESRLICEPWPSASTPKAPTGPSEVDRTPPAVLIVIGPVAVRAPPFVTKSPTAPSPWVAKDSVPLRLACEPEPDTKRACAPWPAVEIEPPPSVNAPPESACAPNAFVPIVVTTMPFGAMIADPAPVA